MQEQQLFAKVARGLARDRHLRVGEILRKGVRLVTETIRARVALRSCNTVGVGGRIAGRMRVGNDGSICIGNGFRVTSSFLPVELLTGSSGRIGASRTLAKIPKTESGEKGPTCAESSICENRQASKGRVKV